MGGLHGFYYEDLVERPGVTLPRVFEAVGEVYDPSLLRSIRRPSITTQTGSGVLSGGRRPRAWESELTVGEVADVREIVRAFGLDGLYRDSGEPSGLLF